MTILYKKPYYTLLQDVMKKTLLLLLLTLAPLYANAQVKATSTESAVDDAQVFTACSQASIEARDESIASARTAYNNAMNIALDARKDAEKRAVALTDASEKKAAIKVAVDDYKKAVTQAQDGLIKARKEAWATFETDMNTCREMKDKSSTGIQKAETKTLQVENQAREPEAKSLKETIKAQFESLKNFFMKSDE